MAGTHKKAHALAGEMHSELRLRGAVALAESGIVSLTVDTDGDPLIVLGDGLAGTQSAIVKVRPIDWPLAKNIVDMPEEVYTPHVIQILVETGNFLDWPLKLMVFGVAFGKGTRVEYYEDAAPLTSGGIDPANLVASFEASAQYPLWGQ